MASTKMQLISLHDLNYSDLTNKVLQRYRNVDVEPPDWKDVTDYAEFFGAYIPYFERFTLPPGTYIFHTYFAQDGIGTGSYETVVMIDEAL
ncbi:MAG: hypothetical protein WKF88_09360 [Ferruginibacter sp.]